MIPVTQAELDTMRAAYQPDLLVESVDDVAVTTREGTAPALPATVAAELGDGSTEQVEVRWDAVAPASYAAPGTFTVTGTVVRGSADHPVATVTVTDAADPVVALAAGTADGDDGWWVTDPVRATATATDATGVESVSVSVDDAPWVRTAGATASAQVTGDGTHTVRARALDTTGNTSAVESLQVRIDTSDPVSRATYDADRTVTIRAADATSGLRRTEYRIGTRCVDDVRRSVRGRCSAGRSTTARSTAPATSSPPNTLTLPAVGAEPAATSIAASGAATARWGTTAPLVVRVSGTAGTPTGTVRVVSGDRLVASGQLVDGRVRLAVDTTALGVGTHDLQVRYDGSAGHAASTTTSTLRVAKAGSTTTVRVVRTVAPGPRRHRPARAGARPGARRAAATRRGREVPLARPVRRRPRAVAGVRSTGDLRRPRRHARERDARPLDGLRTRPPAVTDLACRERSASFLPAGRTHARRRDRRGCPRDH